MKRIAVAVTNDIVTDQRVKKVCDTLHHNGYKLTLIGRKLPHSLPVKRPYKTIRFRLLFKKGILFYTEYNIRLFTKLLFLKTDIFLANDLDTLVPIYIICKIRKKKLVFDSHELFSETSAVQGRWVKKVWRFLENAFIPKLTNTITVCNSIAKWYQQHYKINPVIVRNIPVAKEIPFQNTANTYLLYQGALNKGRGLFQLLDAMVLMPDQHLKIAGTGPLQKTIASKVALLKLQKRVELLGNLHPDELIHITQNAVLGLSIEEDIGLSYRYALPNKLFDYIQAKIPVVTTYLPEIRNIVQTYGVGEIIEDHHPETIASTIDTVLKNGKLHYKEQLEIAAKELIWAHEEERLLTLFRSI